ncbi:apolipoprotein N-acyltransferase [Pasteurellaceae bacterium 15-036681]|nr:apolipoprotein N-acyltransferase [Pasteurellaceae bacterium 15-036681]
MNNKISYLIAIISGGIGFLAYSPFDYWLIAFLSASGLVYSATLTARKTALICTFLWAVSYFAVGVNWVHISMIQFGGVPEAVSYLAVLLLASYLALYPLLFSYLSQRFNLTNPLVLASIFTFTEFLRETVFTGFPWLQFGYSLIDSPFANLATVFGVEGLTFFVIATSGYILQMIYGFAKKQPFPTACLSSLIVLCVIGVATKLLPTTELDKNAELQRVSLVQGNIEQKMKWDPAHFDHTVRTYEHLVLPHLTDSDVVILPESAIPALEYQIEPLLKQLDEVAAEKSSEVIIGTLHQDQTGMYNSAVVLGNQNQPYSLANAQRYNKHHLVPFGEYVPFGNLLDWMREVFVLPINLSKGDYIQKPLIAGNYSFNMAICYEIIYGGQVQQNQKANNADYLLTITNDAWFGSSIGPWQHFQMARMRALELGKPLLRAANTGITAFVDNKGNVVSQLPQFEVGVLTAEISPTVGQTIFGQFGRWLIWGLCAVILLGSVFSKRRK